MADHPDFYSQNFEDVMLARCFSNRLQGFYIDVGAHVEEADSVTKHFYEAGWSGINIEPVKEFADTFDCRNRDITICCAAGAHDGVDTLAISLRTGLSTLDSANAAKADAMGHIAENREIAIKKLDNILLGLGYETLSFEFLKIDVEGFELYVLEGIDLHRYRPEIILCEVTEPNSSQKSENYAEICNRVEGFDYLPVYFDGLNQWWCAIEKMNTLASHFTLPPGVFDSPTLTPYHSYSTLRQLARSAEHVNNLHLQLVSTIASRDHAIAAREATEQEINTMKASWHWRIASFPLKLARLAKKRMAL
jgi:FkbM family methyltransferase